MIRLLPGDARDVLATLPADSVHTVVTSPPYYGLRDYGTALWDGGDAACSHLVGALVSSKSKLRLDGREHVGPYDGEKAVTAGMPFRDMCGKCGAVRIDRQIGLEASPDEYLATMVAVFREIRRVLRPDGTVWCNMGDSYNANSQGSVFDTNRDGGGRKNFTMSPKVSSGGLAAKQLLLMPARLALALQADGWWVRSDIIWHKPNPMPESCTDRPTSAHEHVFLLTKNARYYFDADAVREESEMTPQNRFTNGRGEKDAGYAAHRRPLGITEANGRNLRNVWTIATAPFSDWGETSRQVRVAWDAGVDGKKRKASPDCPVHGDQAVQAPNAGDDAHADDSLIRIARNGVDPAQAPTDDCAPSAQHHEPMSAGQSSGSLPLWHSSSATLRSSQSHKTDLVSATSQPCSVSAQTGDDIARTSEALEPVDSAGYMPESNSGQDDSGDRPSARIGGHSADMSSCCCEWYITKTEKTSHFATFPPALAERCIRAGTSERGCCAQCGKPWTRVTDTSYERNRHGHSGRTDASGSNGWDGGAYPNLRRINTTTGWQPGCKCYNVPPELAERYIEASKVVPCTVLDPFAGAGTTLLCADRLQRDAIGIELNVAYTQMAMDRVRADAPLLVDAPVPEPPEDARMGDLFDMAAD